MMDNKIEANQERTLGRTSARELSIEEMKAVSGGSSEVSIQTHTDTVQYPFGDCDANEQMR